MSQTVALLSTRLKYLTLIPGLFVNAITVEGATECIRQVESKALELHDPLTRQIAEELMPDIRAVAAGGVCSQRLEEQVARLRDSPLDESLGESFHGEIANERRRAAATGAQTIKYVNRARKTHSICKWMIRVYKAAGKRVIRNDWRTYKRLLQPQRRNMWTSKRMKDSMCPTVVSRG